MEARHKDIADLKKITGKCPRCSLCKFPPLAVVEHQKFSTICPSYDEYKFHSHSGGGRIVMGLSLDAGRSEVTGRVRDAAFSCTLCGGCDMACKFSSDIEITDALYALRNFCFKKAGPLPVHAKILERMEKHGNPVADGGDKAGWMKDARVSPKKGKDFLLYVGCRYALLPERRETLVNLVRLLTAAGLDFGLLGSEEPCCGRAALDLGNRDLFDRMARATVEAVKRSGATRVVCADAECFSTFRAHFPKVADLGVEVLHPVQVLADAVKKRKLKFRKAFSADVAFHDPCNLGRLSEPYAPWDGEIKKVLGQLIVYDPPRPINRGTGGCYDPPRKLLSAVPGIRQREFSRRREYAYCCGGGGGAAAAFPEFAKNTAATRLAEAADRGASVVATACPNCAANLGEASAETGVRVMELYDLLALSL